MLLVPPSPRGSGIPPDIGQQVATPCGVLPIPCLLAVSGSDRLGLSAFPPLQTGQAPFNASGFPVRSPDCLAAGWRLVRSSQGAPVIVPTDHCHLLSLVHPLSHRSEDFPWQTFTLSWPLQPGFRLLRCLRPLFRTLAFWRLLRVKRHESSLIPNREVNATRSCLLYAGRTKE